MTWIHRLFIFFLGIILSVTTGFGISAFYPEPMGPTYPSMTNVKTLPISCDATPETRGTVECKKLIQEQELAQAKDDEKRQEYDALQSIYQQKNADYTRTAIFFGIVIGALFAIIGLALIKTSKLIATGMLLGGLLTAILTRFLISLASLGSSVSSTGQADTMAYAEFIILFIFSIAVIGVGHKNLRDDDVIMRPHKKPTVH